MQEGHCAPGCGAVAVSYANNVRATDGNGLAQCHQCAASCAAVAPGASACPAGKTLCGREDDGCGSCYSMGWWDPWWTGGCTLMAHDHLYVDWCY
jgi:hypothetical protein